MMLAAWGKGGVPGQLHSSPSSLASQAFWGGQALPAPVLGLSVDGRETGSCSTQG